MAKDRIAALKEFQAAAGDGEGGIGMVVVKMDGEGDSEDDMQTFFIQVNELRKLIEEISKSVEKVRQRHSDVLAAPFSDQRVKLEMDDLTEFIKNTANKVRAKLEGMKKDIKFKSYADKSSASERIRQSQYSTIWHQFIEVMNQYNNAQLEYRDSCKTRIKRHMEIAGRNIENDELESMIESGDMQVFTREIHADTQAAKQTLADIEDRQIDILQLENSIRELHDMFTEIAALVQDHGEIINRIEHNVQRAVDHIESAKKSTTKAKIYQSNAGKKKVICYTVVVVAAIIIILIIALPLALRKK